MGLYPGNRINNSQATGKQTSSEPYKQRANCANAIHNLITKAIQWRELYEYAFFSTSAVFVNPVFEHIPTKFPLKPRR